MSSEMHPAAETLYYVRQGTKLIGSLDAKLFAGDPTAPKRGGVGAHFRHCLDFYLSFLNGLESGRIDFAHRERETRVEVDREYAIQSFDRVCTRLEKISPADLSREFEVRVERSESGTLHDDSAPEYCRSSLQRELQFLVSHTVHHFAIIKLHLELRGFDVSQLADFGVAPSTQNYWQQSTHSKAG